MEHIRTDWDERVLLELALKLASPRLYRVPVRIQEQCGLSDGLSAHDDSV